MCCRLRGIYEYRLSDIKFQDFIGREYKICISGFQKLNFFKGAGPGSYYIRIFRADNSVEFDFWKTISPTAGFLKYNC